MVQKDHSPNQATCVGASFSASVMYYFPLRSGGGKRCECRRDQRGHSEAFDDEEGKKIMTEQAVNWKTAAETILDVRPDLESDGEPFVRIMEAVSAM
jgi:hypothetical protein